MQANINLELKDIQGFVIRSYSKLPDTEYVMLRFNDSEKAKMFLSSIIPQIPDAKAASPKEFAIHMAFTNCGVFKLLSKEKLVVPFSRAFTEGIVNETRSRILGDVGSNDPSQWEWGNSEKPVDAMLMLFAKTESILNHQRHFISGLLSDCEIERVVTLPTIDLKEKEHFGFKDGMSNPRIRGVEKEKGSKEKPTVETGIEYAMPGEFILGYPNEYNKLPFSPVYTTGEIDYDIGRNGTYLVFRQLKQDVAAFWKFMFDAVKMNPQLSGMDPVQIAAKMIGRYPNGKPLTEIGTKISEKDVNSFLFMKKDRDGYGCPIGAHIRKVNPRDSIGDDPDDSIEVIKKHRIIRRGRPYGEPLSKDFDFFAMQEPDNKERGLHFICLNARIQRQFEFIQQTWANNNKFNNLFNDIDPIIGVPTNSIMSHVAEFTIQSQPFRKKIEAIPQFVFVRGGAYFFMPGLSALRFMASVLA